MITGGHLQTKCVPDFIIPSVHTSFFPLPFLPPPPSHAEVKEDSSVDKEGGGGMRETEILYLIKASIQELIRLRRTKIYRARHKTFPTRF